MTNAETEAAIILAVGPQGHLSDGTIAFAVETAARLELGLELVHVVPNHIGGPTGTWEIGITFDQMVAEAAPVGPAVRRVRDRAPAGLPVSGESCVAESSRAWWTVASWLSWSSSSTATSGDGIGSRQGP